MQTAQSKLLRVVRVGSTSVARLGFPVLLGIGLSVANFVPVFGQNPNVQAPSSNGAAKHSSNPTATKRAHAKSRRVKPVDPQPVAEVKPPDPPAPDWPVDHKAEPATVGWDGRDLTIGATNSSLNQILRDVSTATGVQVEGVSSDQRIYGNFGPAPARDVLSMLLDGSGYNMLMIGDQGEGTPRELVLTAKASGAGHPQGAGANRPNTNSDDDALDDPEPPEQQEPAPRHPFGGPPGMNRNPQQIYQDLQRQQQNNPGQPVPQQPGQVPPGGPPNN
jgi:hypothetical protein